MHRVMHVLQVLGAREYWAGVGKRISLGVFMSRVLIYFRPCLNIGVVVIHFGSDMNQSRCLNMPFGDSFLFGNEHVQVS